MAQPRVGLSALVFKSVVFRYLVEIPAAGFQPLACGALLALKQSLQSTALPVDGLKGTESVLPH